MYFKTEYLKKPGALRVHGLKNFDNVLNLSYVEVAILVLNDNNEDIGEVVRFKDWIQYLVVKEEYRHMGIGSSLLEAIEDEAILNNIKELKLHPAGNEKELIQFYSKMNWIPYNHKGNVIMYKELMPKKFAIL